MGAATDATPAFGVTEDRHPSHVPVLAFFKPQVPTGAHPCVGQRTKLASRTRKKLMLEPSVATHVL
jgi:hypothetical protein